MKDCIDAMESRIAEIFSGIYGLSAIFDELKPLIEESDGKLISKIISNWKYLKPIEDEAALKRELKILLSEK